jgi:hypothetical protein
MTIISTTRMATAAETAREMDRRGEVIERLEADNATQAAEITRLRAEVDHWQRQAQAAQNNATLFQQDCVFHVAEKARKDEALARGADYLDALEADLIKNDIDMAIDTETPPGVVADEFRAARMPAEGRAALEQEGAP